MTAAEAFTTASAHQERARLAAESEDWATVDTELAAGAAIAREAGIMGAYIVAEVGAFLSRGIVRRAARTLDLIGADLVKVGFPEPTITYDERDDWGMGSRYLSFKESADLTPEQYARFRRDVLYAEDDDDGEPTMGILDFGGIMPAQAYNTIHEGWSDWSFESERHMISSCYVSEYLVGPRESE